MTKKRKQFRIRLLVRSVCICLSLGVIDASWASADTTSPTAIVNTRLGPYRAQAKLSFEAFQRGDSATAAILAQTLDRTWDAGTQDLAKSLPALWKLIDHAMDGYVKPVVHYEKNAPDASKVAASYQEYISKLDLGDSVVVDSTRMGPYRALAKMTYQAFLSPDWISAENMAWILKRTWDGGESDTLGKSSPALFKGVDSAMNSFIQPIMGFRDAKPDPEKVAAAYTDYLAKLKLAD